MQAEYSQYSYSPAPAYIYSEDSPVLPSRVPASWARPPNCAVCDAPAKEQCSCEFTSLVIAVEDSEERIMGSMWDDIRRWVTSRAQSKIHSDFRASSQLRQAHFNAFLTSSRARHMSDDQLDGEHFRLQRDIDNDWRGCVQKYPQVLDHFYGIVSDAVRSGRGWESVVYGTASSGQRYRERSTSRGSSSGGGGGGGGGVYYTHRRSGPRHGPRPGTPRRVRTD